MPSHSPELESLAAALADGTAVDWQAAEAAAVTPGDRHSIRQLKLIARIVGVYGDGDRDASRRELGDATARGAPHLQSSPPGARWGPLEVGDCIGRGSFGEVYRARDVRLDREVALKLLQHPGRAGTRDEAPDVVDEGRMLARVRHPNVASVFGADRIDGRVGVWMEFIDGRTLEEELRDRGPFPYDEAIRIAIDLCRALAAVHEAGLLHRDLKAQNVMRDRRDGRVVLMDFSAGRELTALLAADPALPASLAGSPLYLAPEVLAGRAATPRSDIYSLGVLLFRLVTGSFPITGDRFGDILDAHSSGRRRCLTDLRPDLPRRFTLLVDRATAPQAEGRFESAREMEGALVLALGGRRRRRARLIVAACLLVAAAAAVALVGRQRLVHGPAAAPAESVGGVTLRQLVFDPQKGINLRAPSGDGQWATCNANGALALCNLQNGDVRRLRVPTSYAEGPSGSALSPDGRTVAYVWTRRDPLVQTLRAIAADGSNDREVYRPPEGSWLALSRWARDGRRVLLHMGGRTGLARCTMVDLAGGAARDLWPFDLTTDTVPDLSPDERHLVLARVQPDTHSRDLVVVDLPSRQERWLEPHVADDSSPRWTPDGRAVVFISERLGTRALFVVPMEDGAPAGDVRLVRDMGRSTVQMLGFTNAGTLFLRVITGWTDVLRASVNLRDARASGVGRVDSSSLDENAGPDWSPDGRRIAYVSGSITGSGEVSRILIRTADGRLEREVPLPSEFSRRSRVRWAPDGRSMAVTYETTDGMALDVVDLGTSRFRRVTTGKVTGEVRWDIDGARLLYADGGSLWSVDLRTHAARAVYRAPSAPMSELANFDVSRLDGSIAFVARHDDPESSTTLRILRRDGAVVDRYRFRGECFGVAWSRDGARLLVSAAETPAPGALRTVSVMDAQGGEPRPLSPRLQDVNDVSLGPADREMVFASGNPRPEFWVVSGLTPPEPAARSTSPARAAR